MSADERLAAEFWQKISSAYSEKGRYYHTLIHVGQLLNLSVKYFDNVLDISNMQLSIFYHDVVYSATKSNNEEKSAELAENHLKQLGIETEKIEKCKNFILATKSHLNPLNDSDLDLFLDFDLEKLGAPWVEYEEYTKQIRQEYKIYPKPLYNKGRKKVLEHFLAKERIYKTSAFFENYEQGARENIERELASISKNLS
jgi:predicted metal-dependent HD superfamily phosphohydrolase